jgi:GT2 family glycosyltransferase
MSYPKVTIIIPNWNGRQDTLECLASIEKLNYPQESFETMVVDNGSTDGSVEAIRNKFTDVDLLVLERNYGYAGALNRGIEKSKAKYVLCINNDTVLDTDLLRSLVDVAESETKAAVVGPKVYFYDRKDVIQKVYGKIDGKTLELINVGSGEKDQGQYDEVREVECCVFCAVLIKREVFEDMGPLEERFFHLYEDNDFYLRCKRMGYRCFYVPKAKIWHKGSKSLKGESPQVIYYFTRNWRLLRSKFSPFSIFEHFKNLRFMVSSLGLMFIDAGKKREYRAVALGIFDYYRGRFGQRTI